MLFVAGAMLVLFIVTFLLGSVPWGLVISSLVYHKDLRSEGSGNIGTTNAMRSLGKVGGAFVFILDFGKGLLSGFLGVLAYSLILGHIAAGESSSADLAWLIPGWCMAIAFAGCVLGHIFSPWLRFHGGKGIAVAVGALFVVYGVWGACIELALFGVLVAATRYVSVGSIAAALLCPFFAFYFYWGNWAAVCLISAVALVVVWAHRENIARLRAGNENRVGSKKKEA